MTGQALAGLAGLNFVFLVCGASVLWVTRGWRSWLEFARIGGLAYLTGVAGVGVVWTLLLVASVPFSGWLVLLTAPAFLAAAVFGGHRLGRKRPSLGSIRGARASIVAVVGVAAAGLLLEAMFRAARLSGLYNWDAWAFWIPKGKAIYYLDSLDEGFFTALPGSSYPPLVPVLDAAAFHAMGSVDVNTLHVQFWFYGAGFVWGLAGVLSERVASWILWPFVVVLLVAPRLGPRFMVPEADLLLDFFFVLAAVLVVLWLLDRQPWRLIVATILLGAMVLTKREGVLLACFVIAAAVLASAPRWREVWRPLAVASAVAVAVAIPWRAWYVVNGVGGEAPAGGGLDPRENTARLWPSLRLALDVLFASGYWNVIVAVGLGALIVGVLARAYGPVLFFGALLALVTLGGAWITWAIPELEITQELGANPIVRYMGAAALLCAAASPLLLAEAWNAAVPRREKVEPS
jgi:hypothetical protein